MTDPRRFLFNSDYPLDKIVFLSEGSWSVTNTTDDTVNIAHGLPFTPLPIIIWSNDSDFATSYEGQDDEYIVDSLNFANFPYSGQYYEVSADSTNVIVDRYNRSGSTKTVYYRIFCFMPSDASAESEVAVTANSGSQFILNTDNNYMKLENAGILENGGVETYNHGLGYVPRLQVWSESSGTIARTVAAQAVSTDPTGSVGATSGVHITDSDLIWLNPSTYNKIHYRLYADE